MTRRYFVPHLPAQGGTIALPEEEAMHAAKVMRVQVGDSLVLFSGDDRQCEGRIASVDRRRVYVTVAPPEHVSRELETRVSVAVAMPKGDRMRGMVEKLTELGVARVIPIIAARSQAAPSPSAIAKLRRAVVEASKQCERNRLMEVLDPLDFTEFVGRHAAETLDENRSLDLVAHPGGHSFRATVAGNSFDQLNLLIGPEGGFVDDEVALAVDRGWQRVGLGQTILRVETAAVAAVARLVLV